MPLALRILAAVGALSFLMIGIDSLVLPLRSPPAPPRTPPPGPVADLRLTPAGGSATSRREAG
jgi:hypothetical protein